MVRPLGRRRKSNAEHELQGMFHVKRQVARPAASGRGALRAPRRGRGAGVAVAPARGTAAGPFPGRGAGVDCHSSALRQHNVTSSGSRPGKRGRAADRPGNAGAGRQPPSRSVPWSSREAVSRNRRVEDQTRLRARRLGKAGGRSPAGVVAQDVTGPARSWPVDRPGCCARNSPGGCPARASPAAQCHKVPPRATTVGKLRVHQLADPMRRGSGRGIRGHTQPASGRGVAGAAGGGRDQLAPPNGAGPGSRRRRWRAGTRTSRHPTRFAGGSAARTASPAEAAGYPHSSGRVVEAMIAVRIIPRRAAGPRLGAGPLARVQDSGVRGRAPERAAAGGRERKSVRRGVSRRAA